jgi:hypothetical protein
MTMLATQTRLETLQEAYDNGKVKARAHFADEYTDYCGTIWGMAEMFLTLGEDIEPMWFSHAWHWPLAGVKDDYTLDTIIKQLCWRIKQGNDEATRGYDPLAQWDSYAHGYYWRLDKVQNAGCLPLEQEAKTLIDMEIKRKYPDCRRNSKRYKELSASVWEKAMCVVRAQQEQERQDAIADLQRWWDKEAKPMVQKAKETAGWTRREASLIALLAPDCEHVQSALDRADRIEQNVNRFVEYFARYVKVD